MHKIKFSFSFLLTILITFSFCLTCFAEETTYVWSSTSTTVNSNSTENLTKDQINTSTNNLAILTSVEEENSNTLNLESESAILIEQSTGQVLYEHNSHEQLRPASVTKVMSILLIEEAINERKNQPK